MKSKMSVSQRCHWNSRQVGERNEYGNNSFHLRSKILKYSTAGGLSHQSRNKESMNKTLTTDILTALTEVLNLK